MIEALVFLSGLSYYPGIREFHDFVRPWSEQVIIPLDLEYSRVETNILGFWPKPVGDAYHERDKLKFAPETFVACKLVNFVGCLNVGPEAQVLSGLSGEENSRSANTTLRQKSVAISADLLPHALPVSPLHNFEIYLNVVSRPLPTVLKIKIPSDVPFMSEVLEFTKQISLQRDPRSLLLLDYSIGIEGGISRDDGGLVRLVGLQEGAPQEASGRNGEGKHSPLRNTVRSLKDKAKDSIILGLIAFAIIGVGGFILLAYGFMRAAEFLVEKVNCGKGQDPE